MQTHFNTAFKSLTAGKRLYIFFGIICLIATNHALAEQQAAQRVQTWQDTKVLNQKVREFLKTQSIGSPGKVEMSITPFDPNLKLEYCPAPQAFFPANAKAWGKTTVGVRCGHPTPWVIYLEANVSIMGNYVVAANPLTQGQNLVSSDLGLQYGDLTTLPSGFLTDISMAVGRSAKVSLTSGTVMKQEMLKMPIVISQGQNIRINSKGPGFSISTEGQALTNAAEGDLVKVRVSNGSIISGIAKNNGQIEVTIR